MKIAKIIISVILSAVAVTLFVLSCTTSFIMYGSWKYMSVDDENDRVYVNELDIDIDESVIMTETVNKYVTSLSGNYTIKGNEITFKHPILSKNTYKFDLKENRIILYERDFGDEDHAIIFKRNEYISLCWGLRIIAIATMVVVVIILFTLKKKKKKKTESGASKSAPAPVTEAPPVETYTVPVEYTVPRTLHSTFGSTPTGMGYDASMNYQQKRDDVVTEIEYKPDESFVPPTEYVPATDYSPGALSMDDIESGNA